MNTNARENQLEIYIMRQKTGQGKYVFKSVVISVNQAKYKNTFIHEYLFVSTVNLRNNTKIENVLDLNYLKSSISVIIMSLCQIYYMM